MKIIPREVNQGDGWKNLKNNQRAGGWGGEGIWGVYQAQKSRNIIHKFDYILKQDTERITRNNFCKSFPHQGNRLRCYQYIQNCSIKDEKDKMGKSKEQCQNCQKSICCEHGMVIGDKRSNSKE